MSKLYLKNRKKDEIANRLTMAMGVLSASLELLNDDSIWAAHQLIEDANTLFEDIHFPGNKLCRGEDVKGEFIWEDDGGN